jgi:glycosyltransferase involved in cell wall biosynthesis
MTASYATAPLRNGLMITWARECFRSSATGLALGIPVHYVWPHDGRSQLDKVWRYLKSSIETFRIILRDRPEVVVVHNLPVFVLISAMAARLVGRHEIVLDFHSGAFTHPFWSRFRRVYGQAIRAAPFVLAHNFFDGAEIAAQSGYPIHLVCLPRDFPDVPWRSPPARPKIMVVCSFKPDEPIDKIFAMARVCPTVHFGVTGNYAKRGLTTQDAPENVTLWGFLDRAAYLREMASATAVLTLSDRPNIMQMAIEEAVSLGVPVVTNRSKTTEPVLEDGGVFCDLTTESLAAAVTDACARAIPLRQAARRLKPSRIVEAQAELNAARRRRPDLFV